MKGKFVKLTIAIALALVVYHLTKDTFYTLTGAIVNGAIPLLIALALSYIMYQTIRLVELLLKLIGVKNQKVLRGISISITLVTTIGSLVGAIYLTMPAIISNLQQLISNLPTIHSRAVEILDSILQNIPFLNEISAETLVGDILGSISEALPVVYNLLLSIIEGTAEGVLILSLIVMMCIMILYETTYLADSISTAITHLFGYKVENMLNRSLNCANVVLGGYYLGKLTESSIVGVASLVYYLIIGVPYAPFFSILLALAYLIPFIGGYIALVPTAILLVFDTPLLALWTVLGGLIIVNVVGMFLSPLVLKSKLNIHPITVIVSVLIGGELLGLIGLIIAPPVASLIKMAINIYSSRRKKPVPVDNCQ